MPEDYVASGGVSDFANYLSDNDTSAYEDYVSNLYEAEFPDDVKRDLDEFSLRERYSRHERVFNLFSEYIEIREKEDPEDNDEAYFEDYIGTWWDPDRHVPHYDMSLYLESFEYHHDVLPWIIFHHVFDFERFFSGQIHPHPERPYTSGRMLSGSYIDLLREIWFGYELVHMDPEGFDGYFFDYLQSVCQFEDLSWLVIRPLHSTHY